VKYRIEAFPDFFRTDRFRFLEIVWMTLCVKSACGGIIRSAVRWIRSSTKGPLRIC
jgi:hypothetical protein